jgi:hypothetical protein
MRTSIDQSLLQVLNNDTADVRSRPRNALESTLAPDERTLACSFIFLSHTSHFTIREVLAFMRPYDAESGMPFFSVLADTEIGHRCVNVSESKTLGPTGRRDGRLSRYP